MKNQKMTRKNKITVLYNQGKELLKKAELEKALEIFQEARDLNPNKHAIFYLLGETLRRMNKLEEAISTLCHAQELYELSLAKKDGVEDCSEEMNDIPSAIDLSEFGKNPKINYALAKCWKGRGDFRRSVEILKETAESLFGAILDDNAEAEESPAGIFNKAEIFLASEMHEEAYALLQPLVLNKILAVDRAQSGVASR
jgi:tetratricopeptide (TPR) repeat protein